MAPAFKEFSGERKSQASEQAMKISCIRYIEEERHEGCRNPVYRARKGVLELMTHMSFFVK